MLSPYIIMFILIVIGLIMSQCVKSYENRIYVVLLIAMTLFLALRSGQGTDYNMYEWLYNIAPRELDLQNHYFSNDVHSELSWKLIMVFAKSIGISFEIFIALLTTLMCWSLHLFISKYSVNPVLSLLIAYPNLILIYYASGLRQGLVIAVFLGYLISMYLDGKWAHYFILTICLTTIHSSAAVFLALPLIKNASFKSMVILAAAFLFLGFIPIAFPSINSFLGRFPFIGFYFDGKGSIGLSIPNALRRVAMFVVIFISYLRIATVDTNEETERFVKMTNVYVFGFALYLLFISSSVAAARFFAAMQMLEIALIPFALSALNFRKRIGVVLIVVFNTVLLWNVLSSFIAELDYYHDSWLTYPYYSVFTAQDVIAEDRPPSFDLP